MHSPYFDTEKPEIKVSALDEMGGLGDMSEVVNFCKKLAAHIR